MWRAPIRPARAGTLLLAVALGGCGSLLQAEHGLADSAAVTVEGSSAVPLLLVTSTHYVRIYDLFTGETEANLITADTVRVAALPYQSSHDLKRKDRFLARLVNPDTAVTANVRLEVRLDGRLVYSQWANIRDAALQYMTYFQPN
jgi:hypothetical protein